MNVFAHSSIITNLHAASCEELNPHGIKYGVGGDMLLHPLAMVKPQSIPIAIEAKKGKSIEKLLDETISLKEILLGEEVIRNRKVREILGGDYSVIDEQVLENGDRQYIILINPQQLFVFLGLDSPNNDTEVNITAETQRICVYTIENPENRPMTNIRMIEVEGALVSQDPYMIYNTFSTFCRYYGYEMRYKKEIGKYTGEAMNLRKILEHYFTIVNLNSGEVTQWETVLQIILKGFSARTGSMLDIVHNGLKGTLHSRDPETMYSQFSLHNYNFLTFFDPDIILTNIDNEDERKKEQWIDIVEAKKAIKLIAQIFGFTGRECEEFGLSILYEYLKTEENVSTQQETSAKLFSSLLKKQKSAVEGFVRGVRNDNIKNKNIILAWDDSIGIATNYENLLTELELRFSAGNVRFVRAKGGELQERIVSEKNKLQGNVEVILITNSKNVDALKSIERRYTTVINDKQITAGNYLPVLEILTFAMSIVYDKDNSIEISRLYKEITNTELTLEQCRSIISAESILLTLPPIDAIDIDQLGEIYKLSAALLVSA